MNLKDMNVREMITIVPLISPNFLDRFVSQTFHGYV